MEGRICSNYSEAPIEHNEGVVNGFDDRRRMSPWRLQWSPGGLFLCLAGTGNLTGFSGQFALTSCNVVKSITPKRYHL